MLEHRGPVWRHAPAALGTALLVTAAVVGTQMALSDAGNPRAPLSPYGEGGFTVGVAAVDKRITITSADDGSYVLGYTPAGGDVVLDLDLVSGQTLQPWWYDPATGRTLKMRTLPKAGVARFPVPKEGGPAWVLVVDDVAAGYGAPTADVVAQATGKSDGSATGTSGTGTSGTGGATGTAAGTGTGSGTGGTGDTGTGSGDGGTGTGTSGSGGGTGTGGTGDSGDGSGTGDTGGGSGDGSKSGSKSGSGGDGSGGTGDTGDGGSGGSGGSGTGSGGGTGDSGGTGNTGGTGDSGGTGDGSGTGDSTGDSTGGGTGDKSGTGSGSKSGTGEPGADPASGSQPETGKFGAGDKGDTGKNDGGKTDGGTGDTGKTDGDKTGDKSGDTGDTGKDGSGGTSGGQQDGDKQDGDKQDTGSKTGTTPQTPAKNTTPSKPADASWDKLSKCESSGNWAINSGNGYYGGLQFDQGTWNDFGGTKYAPRADKATKDQQIEIASKVRDARGGYSSWPACSSKLGLPK